MVEVTITNHGTAATSATWMDFDDFSPRYAELSGCVPDCDADDHNQFELSAQLFGLDIRYPGVGPGETVTYVAEFRITDNGTANWDLCIYDGVAGKPMNQVYCEAMTTVILP